MVRFLELLILILYLKVLLMFFSLILLGLFILYILSGIIHVHHMCLVPSGVRRVYQILWNWIASICTIMWVLEIEAWSPARATSVLSLNL